MKKYAVIDTETSGLFDFRKPADDPGQPRLAQLAIILVERIVEGELLATSTLEFFVKPDGWEMQPEATAKNGLTTERLNEIGVPVANVLDVYQKVVEDGWIIVAFNAQYDTKVMRGEFRRAARDDLFEKTPNICVMRGAQKHGIKNSKGRGFPSLHDVCAHLGIGCEEAHNALHDAQAAFEVFSKLDELGALPEPAVHFAKNPPGKEAA
jgi:DNA polymerase-3 subunit epsilon